MMTVITMGFPGGSDNKESAYNAGNLDSIPGSGRSPGEGNGYPCQYSGLEHSMARGAWWATQSMVLQRNTTEQLLLSHRIMIIITIIKLKKRKICNIHMKPQLIAISNLYVHQEQLIVVVTVYTLQWARGSSWMCFEQGGTALQADSSPSEPPGKLLECCLWSFEQVSFLIMVYSNRVWLHASSRAAVTRGDRFSPLSSPYLVLAVHSQYWCPETLTLSPRSQC